MAHRSEIISKVSRLIGTLKNGVQGYEKAAEAANDPRLRSLFTDYSHQRARFVAELQEVAGRLGQSSPENTNSATGALHRAWISLRIAVSQGDDRAILAECERGEDSALHRYEKAVHNGLSLPLRDIVSRQYSEVKSAHDRIKSLRSTVKAS